MKTYLSLLLVILAVASTLLDCHGQQHTLTILPTVTGTVEFFPEFGILRNRGNELQSTYFRTTALNREFRRAFLEFSLPQDFAPLQPNGRIVATTLVLTDGCAGCGWTPTPTPPDTHEIGYYPADLVVETNDYEVAAAPLAVFQTRADVFPETIAIDVKDIVEQFRGTNVGFRIKLAADPEYFGEGFLGSGFGNTVVGNPSRIVITVSNPPPRIEVRTLRRVAVEPREHGPVAGGLFVVERSGNTNQTVRVRFALEGKAVNGLDYAFIVGQVALSPGQTSAEISVHALADAEVEAPENVILRLLPPANGTDYEVGGRSQARVVILDRSRSTALSRTRW